MNAFFNFIKEKWETIVGIVVYIITIIASIITIIAFFGLKAEKETLFTLTLFTLVFPIIFGYIGYRLSKKFKKRQEFAKEQLTGHVTFVYFILPIVTASIVSGIVSGIWFYFLFSHELIEKDRIIADKNTEISTYRERIDKLEQNIKVIEDLGEQGIPFGPKAFIACDDPKVVEYFMEGIGTEIEKKDDHGNTFLIYASQQGHEDIVAKLLEYKPNIDSKNNNDETALMLAVQNGHDNIVRLLLEHNAASDIKDIHGKIALMYAIEKEFTNIIKVLLDHNPEDINIEDNQGKNSLSYAHRTGDFALIKLINTYQK